MLRTRALNPVRSNSFLSLRGGGGTAPAVNVTSNSNVVQDNIFETVSILYLKLRDSVFCLVSSDTF